MKWNFESCWRQLFKGSRHILWCFLGTMTSSVDTESLLALACDNPTTSVIIYPFCVILASLQRKTKGWIVRMRKVWQKGICRKWNTSKNFVVICINMTIWRKLCPVFSHRSALLVRSAQDQHNKNIINRKNTVIEVKQSAIK